jgi:hypothetical protein
MASYNDEDDWAKAQGYDDFADYTSSLNIPSSTGIGNILTRANRIVNDAHHGDKDNASSDTDILSDYELLVANRIVDNAIAREQGERPPHRFLIYRHEKRKLQAKGGEIFNADVDVIG